MKLIVVESPTKAKTLSRFLGGDFLLVATMGHIMDLPKSKLGVDIDRNFKPEYLEIVGKEKNIRELLGAAKKVDTVYLATDPDREGEAIASHVGEVLSKTKFGSDKYLPKRIVFHEITKEAVEEALQNPRKVDGNLVDAQIARRVLDRLVGYNLSPLLWKKVRRGLSAGRVQSVTVRLIVEKEREIESFKPVEYWEIYVVLHQKNAPSRDNFSVQLVRINKEKAEIKNSDQVEKAVTDLEKSSYKVEDLRSREVVKQSYPPFTTSTMTQTAARLYSWSAKRTMRIAQNLYEQGLITYHRTDSVNIAKAAMEKVRTYISKNFGDKYLPVQPRYFKKASKLAQEAHEAIRPTEVDKSGLDDSNSKISKEDEKLYKLIWKRFVASQMSASVFDETVIEVSATNKSNNSNYLLRVSGSVMKFDGWRKVIPLTVNEEPQLPKVEVGESLDKVKVDSFQKFTQPPARYNEASLIKTLEKMGIGRPSTYAPIISTIQIRQYVEKEEGKFIPTPVGKAVTDFLVTNFSDIVDYPFTAKMEDGLDDVASGKGKWQKMMGDFYNPFSKKFKEVEKNSKRVKIEAEKIGKKCPTCKDEGRTGDKQGELVIRVGRFGKFISCSLFPDCKHTEKYIEKLNLKCPECKTGEVIIKTTRRGKKFYGCSRYPECKWASWKKPVLEKQ